jgi:PAS domain S-box-containing protein
MSSTERRPLRAVLLLLAGLFCASVAGAIGARVVSLLEELRTAPQDNAHWSLSQIEVDLMLFAASLRDVADGSGTPSTARRRLDLLYSRHAALDSGLVFAPLRARATISGDLDRLQRFVTEAAIVVDGGDEALTAGAPAVLARVPETAEAIRAIALEGVTLFAERADERRREILKALRAAFAIALALIVALGATLLVLMRQQRISTLRADGIRRSRARLAATVDASLDAIVAIDDEGRIRGFNAAAEQTFGRRAPEAQGRDAFDLLAPARLRGPLRRGMRRCVTAAREGRPVSARIETVARRAGGAEFPAELSIAAAVDEDGGALMIGYLRDISDRVAAERSLRAARDDALAADRAKSKFLAVMSHEMRTPLNGVTGLLDMLAQTDLGPQQRQYVEIARASGDILRRRLDEVLDIARIEKGALRLEMDAFEPSRVLGEVADVTRPAAAAGGNVVVVECDPALGPLIGDANRIRQVMLNFAANAAKFSRESVVTLEARLCGAAGDAVEVEFAVRDQGVGVRAEDQERIFEDFVTLGADHDRGASGAGLGLAISRRLVEAMDGRIGVRSAPGEGARFWFRLALRRALSIEADTPELAPTCPPLRVLCVEDNPTNRFVLRELLTAAGHAVVEAADGAEGVARALAERFDVILMDIGMPRMDGVAAARAIRERAGPAGAPPILALTAHALPDERRAFAEAGMRGCLTKPIRRTALLFALAEAVSAGAGRADAPDGDEGDLLDDEVLADLVASLSTDAFVETVSRFLEDLARMVPRIEALAAGSDDAALAAETHRLAGSAGLLGAAALREALAAIETACKTGRSADARTDAARIPALAAATGAALREASDEIAGQAA